MHRPVGRLGGASFVLVILLGLVGIGCMSEPIQPGAAPPPAQAQIDQPPRQVFERIQQALGSDALGLGVTEAADGVIMTGFERHEGNWHIGRRWQERTRYRIGVIPDWNEPTARSRIEVTAETEERATEGQRWDPNPRLYRAERARQLLDRIIAPLQQNP